MNGDELKMHRRLACLSQTAVGKALGRSFFVIYQMEKGKRAIRPEEEKIFRKMFGLPEDKTLKEKIEVASHG